LRVHRMCVRDRVPVVPSFAGGRLAGTVPGVAEVEEPMSRPVNAAGMG
jgi:hypothetical protein